MVRVTAELHEAQSDLIQIKFAYNAEYVVRVKRVPGARWNKTDKTWRANLSLPACRALREQFGDNLVIGPRLHDWAWAERKRTELLTELGSSDDLTAAAPLVRLPERAPATYAAMESRPYQLVGAAFIAGARSVLVADEPGLGKTIETIAGIIEAGVSGPVLVVSLKTAARAVWEDEITRWGGDAATVTVADGAKPDRLKAIARFRERAKELRKVHFLVVNPEMLRTSTQKASAKRATRLDGMTHAYPELFESPWEAVVIDETGHAQVSLACPSANESKMSQFRLGVKYLPVAEDGLRVALSGTPMRGKPIKLWGTLNWLRPKEFTSFWRWAGTYFDIYKEWAGRAEVFVIGELKDESKLRDDLRHMMIRREKSEVAPDLPPKQIVDVWLDLTKEQARAYDGILNDAAAMLESGTLLANGALPEMVRLKQFAGAYGDVFGEHFAPKMPSNKIDHIMMMLEDRGITGKPSDDEGTSGIVIGSQFTALLNLLAKELEAKGIEFHMITGEVKDNVRAAAVRQFQSGEGPRVFLLNTNAGGVAITLDRADEMVIMDETWIPDDQEQLENRIHRVSRVHPVSIYYLRSRGTIDEAIAAGNKTADELVKSIINYKRTAKTKRGDKAE